MALFLSLPRLVQTEIAKELLFIIMSASCLFIPTGVLKSNNSNNDKALIEWATFATNQWEASELTASIPWFSCQCQSLLVIQKVLYQVATHHESCHLFMQSLSKSRSGF